MVVFYVVGLVMIEVDGFLVFCFYVIMMEWVMSDFGVVC